MNERVKTVLEHMLEDAEEGMAFAKEVVDFDGFCDNALVRKAVIMSLLNIGELAHHLPDEFTSAHPGLPWKQMTGMRNLAAHGYHAMSYLVVWDTVKASLPALARFLRKQLYDA